MTDAALLKRQKKEIEELRAKLTVDLVFRCLFFSYKLYVRLEMITILFS
jgi:hypothetical protein